MRKAHQYTTRRAAVATVHGRKEVLDPLVSKYKNLNEGQGPCEYEIRDVSDEALLATRRMPRVIARVQTALSSESGNQLADIFDSEGESWKRFTLANANLFGGPSIRDQGQRAVRTDGSTCTWKSAVAFHALVDLYSRDRTASCKEVRLMDGPAHTWVEVLTHADERMVFETWTLFPEVVAAEDGFAYAQKEARVTEVWRPGMRTVEPWADFVKAAIAEGPIEQAPPSARNWLDTLHRDRGLQGYAQANVESLNVSAWDRAEACLTSAERVALGMSSSKRVVYRGPKGDTYNGDLVRQSQVDRYRRTHQAMRKAGFPERFEAREVFRRDLTCAVQADDAATVVSLLMKHGTLIATGPDCSGVLDDALWAAVQSRRATHVEIADALIEAGANEQATRDGGQTLLMEAAALGDLAMVTALHDQGLRSDQRSDRGHNAFHLACNRGHVAVGEYLRMKTPLLLHEPDSYGNTPLMLASLGGSLDMVQALLKAGAEAGTVNSLNGSSAHSLAVNAGHVNVAYQLQLWQHSLVSMSGGSGVPGQPYR